MRIAWLLVLVACTRADDTEPPPTVPPTELVCEPGTKPADGECLAAGVPPNECAAGFSSDQQGGCVPILPPEACSRGTMAVPGDSSCQPVAPCASGRWGDIPVDGTTQYVDASYAGTDSDGSAERPWTTIGDAVDAAEPLAIVAMAAGSYPGILIDKPVRLWGVCPELVTAASTTFSIEVRGGAEGSEIRNLGISGSNIGLGASGVQNVLVERVWIHDTGSAGALIDSAFGPTVVTIRKSLVEHAALAGVALQGSTVVFDASVVRDTVTVDANSGRGISAVAKYGLRSNVTVTSSFIERNADVGIFVWGSDAQVEGTLVRGTLPSAAATGGSGIGVGYDGEQRSSLVVSGSVLDWNRGAGVLLVGSDGDIETTVVRDMIAAEVHPRAGRGLAVYNVAGSANASTLAVRRSLLERTVEMGVHVIGSDVTVEQTIVRASGARPDDLLGGRGISAQDDAEGDARSRATLRWSVVEQCREGGVLVVGSDAEFEASRVVGTLPSELDGSFGDGVVVAASIYGPDASVSVSGSRIETNARAGVSSFGGTLSLASTTLECNPIHLDGESYAMRSFQFVDDGGNDCGCNDQRVTCAVLSSNLAPPGAL